MRRWLLLAVLLVAACGSDKTAEVAAARQESTTTIEATTTTTTLATTTTVKTATARQYGSIIAKNDTSMRNAIRSASPCLGIVPPGCTVAASISVFTMTTSAEILRLELDGAATVSNRTFIGAPPPEIKALYDATLMAATVLSKLGGVKCEPAACPDSFAIGRAADALVRQLDAWRPYL